MPIERKPASEYEGAVEKVYYYSKFIGLLTWNYERVEWRYGFNGFIFSAKTAEEAIDDMKRRYYP